MEIESLKRVPEPTELYKKWRCLIWGDEDKPEQLEKGRRTLKKEYQDDDAVKKIEEYEKKLKGIVNHNIQWAEMALAINKIDFDGEGMAPVEKIEVKETDKKKHGNTQWMLIVGFEFWMDEERTKSRKLYIPLDPENPKFDLIRFLKKTREEKEDVDWKMRAAGEEEKGYPESWDDF